MSSKKTALCEETGLYKAFLELLKVHTCYMKNIDRAYQMMYSQESTSLLLDCARSFITSYNSLSLEAKLLNISDVKNKLIAYDLIIRVFSDEKILSLRQISEIGKHIAIIQMQLSGFEKKIESNIG